jgi:hypothetical protein
MDTSRKINIIYISLLVMFFCCTPNKEYVRDRAFVIDKLIINNNHIFLTNKKICNFVIKDSIKEKDESYLKKLDQILTLNRKIHTYFEKNKIDFIKKVEIKKEFFVADTISISNLLTVNDKEKTRNYIDSIEVSLSKYIIFLNKELNEVGISIDEYYLSTSEIILKRLKNPENDVLDFFELNCLLENNYLLMINNYLYRRVNQ